MASTDQASLFWGFLCFSILLHSVILASYMFPGAGHPRAVERRPIQASFRAPVIRPARSTLLEQPRVVPPTPTVLSRKAELARRTTPRPENGLNRQASKERIVTVPTQEESPKPIFDIDELRAQARALSREPSDRFFGDADANRKSFNASSRTPLSKLTDRPVLEALAKRLGQPSEIIEERVLSDGSRFIRFTGNTCVRIPRFLPLGRENQFTPTILVPMTCS